MFWSSKISTLHRPKMSTPFQHVRNDGDDDPIKHPADDLYTYTLYAQIPPPVIEPGRHLRLPQSTSQLQNELSVRPDSLIRLKTMKTIPALYLNGRCRGCKTSTHLIDSLSCFVDFSIQLVEGAFRTHLSTSQETLVSTIDPYLSF